MQSTKFNSGRIREAGSLETSSRKIEIRSSRALNETPSQYQELFITPIDDDELLNNNNKNNKQSRKSTTNQNHRRPSNNYLNYDLDKIELDNDSSEMKSNKNSSGKSRPKQSHNNPSKTKSERKQNVVVDSDDSDERGEPSDELEISIGHTKSLTPPVAIQPVEKFTRDNNPFLIKSVNFKSNISNEENEEKQKNKTVGQAWLDPNNDSDDEQDQTRPKTGFPLSIFDSTDLPRNNFKLAYFQNLDTLEFLFRPAPVDLLVRCKLLVHAKTLVSNEYDLFLEDYSRLDSPMMTTSSKRASAGVYLSILANIMNPLVRKYREKRVGKLRSDLTRKSYQLNEENSSSRSSSPSQSLVQHFELLYRNRSLTNPTPKEIEVFLRSTETNCFEEGKRPTYKVVTKAPEYDKQTKTYRLDFKGRASVSSVNNMQIVDLSNPSVVLLQLGKTGKRQFILDYSYPFTAFTAFGVALSCLSRS